MRTVNSNRYRISAVQYSSDSTGVTANAAVKFSEFDSIWSGKTFANFKSIALDPATYPDQTLKFNEFTVIPLMKSA
jgi:hypothetical protein